MTAEEMMELNFGDMVRHTKTKEVFQVVNVVPHLTLCRIAVPTRPDVWEKIEPPPRRTASRVIPAKPGDLPS